MLDPMVATPTADCVWRPVLDPRVVTSTADCVWRPVLDPRVATLLLTVCEGLCRIPWRVATPTADCVRWIPFFHIADSDQARSQGVFVYIPLFFIVVLLLLLALYQSSSALHYTTFQKLYNYIL